MMAGQNNQEPLLREQNRGQPHEEPLVPFDNDAEHILPPNANELSVQSEKFMRRMWIFPLLSSVLYLIDGALDYFYRTWASGLPSTLTIIFYFLQYQHPWSDFRVYIYHGSIFVCITLGNLFYMLGRFDHTEEPSGFAITLWVFYLIFDGAFVAIVCKLKKEQCIPAFVVPQSALFHVISRLEVLLAILIPLFSRHDMITTNTIAYFILFDVFSQYYDRMFTSETVLLWVFTSCSIVAVTFEYVDLSWDSTKNGSDTGMKHAMGMLAEVAELLCSILVYILIISSLDPKDSKRKNRRDMLPQRKPAGGAALH